MTEKYTYKLSSRSIIELFPNAIECFDEEFNLLWNEHPQERGHIMMYGKKICVKRFQRLYGAATYKFSGITLPTESVIHPLVQKCLDWVHTNFSDFKTFYNGALVNFYENGDDYIGPHSDDEKDLIKDLPIFSFSFGSTRTFRVKVKNNNEDIWISQLNLNVFNGSVIAMCGEMQTEFKHEVPKQSDSDRRINITVRAFKTK